MFPMKDNPVIRLSRIPARSTSGARSPLLRRSTAWLTALVAAWTLAAPAVGQCEYEVTILPNVPCFGADAVPKPKAINDNGEVVGSFLQCASSSEAAFYWSKETGLVILDMPEGTTNSDAHDINNSGQTVGVYSNQNCEQGYMGFLLDGEEFTCLGTLPGGTNSVANVINEKGMIGGVWGNTVSGPYPLAYIWHDGEMMDLSNVIDGERNSVCDVANNGLMTGAYTDGSFIDSHAYLFDQNVVMTLPTPEGSTRAESRALSTSRVVVGFAQNGFAETRAVRWPAPDTVQVLAPKGSSLSWAHDVNEFGQAVGQVDFDETGVFGVLWMGTDTIYLNDHLAADEQVWIGEAFAINNIGQIVGTGSVDGDGHAFLLTPVNQPESDVTGDCAVNVDDLLFVLNEWGESNSVADITKNGVVDVSDLLMVLSGWGS